MEAKKINELDGATVDNMFTVTKAGQELFNNNHITVSEIIEFGDLMAETSSAKGVTRARLFEKAKSQILNWYRERL